MRNTKLPLANGQRPRKSEENGDYALLLKEIAQRLPELEWKMSGLSTPVSKMALPRHLFSSTVHRQPEQLMQTIKEEIGRLNQEKSSLGAYYLAKKIYQKIKVLVTYCGEAKISTNSNVSHAYKGYLEELCTRNQYIQTTEEQIRRLSEQHLALKTRLSQTSDPQDTLTLTRDLGKLEKRLILIKEALERALL